MNIYFVRARARINPTVDISQVSPGAFGSSATCTLRRSFLWKSRPVRRALFTIVNINKLPANIFIFYSSRSPGVRACLSFFSFLPHHEYYRHLRRLAIIASHRVLLPFRKRLALCCSAANDVKIIFCITARVLRHRRIV